MIEQPRHPKHKYGPLADALYGQPANKKHFLKASAHVQAAGEMPLVFERRGITVEINDIGIEDGDLLRVNVAHSTKAGVLLHVDNPLFFHNPPVMTHDGTHYVDDDGNKQPRIAENVLETLKEIITQAVELQNP